MTHLVRLPPPAYLRECFIYEPGTGRLIWRDRPRSHFVRECDYRRFQEFIGKDAGGPRFNQSGDPIGIKIKLSYNGHGLAVLAHRVIFAMLEIEVPDGCVIDHRNRNSLDNRIGNLRIATRTHNVWNKCVWRSKKGALPKGVYRYNKSDRFHALIRVDGRNKRLGVFDTVEQAAKAYEDAANALHGEFACFAPARSPVKDS